MEASKTVNLFVDPSSSSSSLLAFPIVLEATGEGRKQIAPQYRIQRLDHWSDSNKDAIFLTTYGFIFGFPREQGDRGQINAEIRPSLLSAAMLCLGSVPNAGDPVSIARACLALQVSCKKSATSEEKVVFTILQAPQILQSCKAVSQKFVAVGSNKCVKAPERLEGGMSFEYRVNFVSLTIVPRGDVYRVPRSVLSVGGPTLFSLALSVNIAVDIAPDNPLSRTLIKTESGFEANLFLHIGLLSTVDKRGKKVTFEKLEGKIRRMELAAGLSDLFGPSVILKAKGPRTKLLTPFFSSAGTACYPISQASPSVSKVLWSQSGYLQSVKIIIQSGTQKAVALTADHEVMSTKLDKQAKIQTFNPFKKN
ncbi:matrix protein [avian paramyxovirus 21]|uniref:Matrix protein n=1 Tax=avian paramyxovirus 21 TaxID=2849510 RepID=A0AAE9G5J1_9MONO|nr:matrix protein [Avian orthoavulavirus 21]